MKTFGFIGGGRVTRILLQGWQNVNYDLGKVIVYDPNPDTLVALQGKFPSIVTEKELSTGIMKSDVVFLAIHPPVMMETLSNIKGTLKRDAILVSLAPKFTIAAMMKTLEGFGRIARVNPSATTMINQGINPVAFSAELPETDKLVLIELLKPLGKSPVVQENKIEAYAMISAMGPTYFWFQMQQLKELATLFGMEENEASEVIEDMVAGSAKTLFRGNLSPEQVMDLVPVKPMGEFEERIKSDYREKLGGVYAKIKP